jgi:hypothetical protein
VLPDDRVVDVDLVALVPGIPGSHGSSSGLRLLERDRLDLDRVARGGEGLPGAVVLDEGLPGAGRDRDAADDALSAS